MTVNEAIEKIEIALFDQDEPGMRDTEHGDLVFTEIGVLRLRRILKEFRDPKPKKRKK
jgi:hypothetical protein